MRPDRIYARFQTNAAPIGRLTFTALLMALLVVSGCSDSPEAQARRSQRAYLKYLKSMAKAKEQRKELYFKQKKEEPIPSAPIRESTPEMTSGPEPDPMQQPEPRPMMPVVPNQVLPNSQPDVQGQ